VFTAGCLVVEGPSHASDREAALRDTPVITIIDSAVAPDKPSGPKPVVNGIIAFLFGAMLAFVLVFLLFGIVMMHAIQHLSGVEWDDRNLIIAGFSLLLGVGGLFVTGEAYQALPLVVRIMLKQAVVVGGVPLITLNQQIVTGLAIMPQNWEFNANYICLVAGAGLMSREELVCRPRLAVEMDNLRAAVGWALDREGYPTTDPKAMIDGGALVSLGGDREHGGHKGYGLALAVDVLCAVLSGANWGPFAPPFALRQALPEREVGKGIGHFFGAMRVDAFRDVNEFKSHIDDFIRTLRATRPAPGTSGPLLPGDPEREAQKERDAGGVPLLPAVLDDLRDIARLTGVPLE
jgi:hypothetical protein